MSVIESELAVLGGPKSVTVDDGDMFTWPIVTEEDEQAVLEVLRAGTMSGTDVTVQFEKEFAEWIGRDYALACCNGTAAVLEAMFGVGLGAGDEIIGPALTYWATNLPALSLQAVPVFADIDPITGCIDPDSVQARITDRTKAIICTHHFGHPCDMDRLTAIAAAHGLKLIEDVSHAQGGLYKGRKLGTFGDVAAMSLMAGKSFAIGEGGILVTNDRTIYERAIAFGHYERTSPKSGYITIPELQRFAGLPLGGVKHRLNQTASAMGRVQLKYYDERCREIRKAMNTFWDLLDGVPGLRAHRVDESDGSTMGGWYNPAGRYVPEELGGLSVSTFAEAVQAEGTLCRALPGNLMPLHLHPMLREADIYGEGAPTILAHSDRDVRIPVGGNPVAESFPDRVVFIPWFKHYRPEQIAQHAGAYRKVAEHYGDLLES